MIHPLKHNHKLRKLNRKYRHGCPHRGFTLIEVLVALAIVSIGLLSLGELQIIAIQGNRHSQHQTTAVILAETKLEELKEAGFNNLANGTFHDINNPVNEKGAPGGIFLRSWTIVDYQNSRHMKKITATIEWPKPQGSYSLSLNTVLSDALDK